MLETVGIKLAKAQAVRAAITSSSEFRVFSGSVPNNPASTPGGTVLADGPINPALVTVSANALLTIGGLSDTQINASGTPTMLRVVTDSGTMQFTCKMAGAAGDAEVVLTDPTDAQATQLLQNRAFTASISIQY